jgi:hypothetical protein
MKKIYREGENGENIRIDKWQLELKDRNRNTYKPIKIEASSLSEGDEYIASYKAFTPLAVEKRKAGVTHIFSIDPRQEMIERPRQ